MRDKQITLILADLVQVVSQAINTMLVERNLVSQEEKPSVSKVFPLGAKIVEPMLEKLEALASMIEGSDYSGDLLQGMQETIALFRSANPPTDEVQVS